MIPKNRITTSILTGASVASATVILSLFEPDRFVLPAVLATAILVFCAPYLTLGRTEGMKEERAYQLAAVVAGVAVGLVILGQPTEGRLIPTIAEAAQQVNISHRYCAFVLVIFWGGVSTSSRRS